MDELLHKGCNESMFCLGQRKLVRMRQTDALVAARHVAKSGDVAQIRK
jgi:hypothetical protein